MKNKSARSLSPGQNSFVHLWPDIFCTAKYSDKDLNEFRKLIIAKLNETKANHALLERTLIRHHNDSIDSCPTFKFTEDAPDVFTKEEIARVARGLKIYIEQLRFALKQILNKTYGVCCISGKRIPKERLLNFPQTTMSEEAISEIERIMQLSS